MKSEQPSDPSIQQLLDHLEQKPDDQVVRTTLIGRALSRSANNVHIAISGGVVAVPISNIEKVTPLSASQPDAVRLVVRNPQEIQTLLRTRPSSGGGKGGGGGTVEALDGDTVQTGNSFTFYVGVGTYTAYDTETVTGGDGGLDACDEAETSGGSPDDLRE
jgi:hypothetical protein